MSIRISLRWVWGWKLEDRVGELLLNFAAQREIAEMKKCWNY
jgi:hypothetical protein